VARFYRSFKQGHQTQYCHNSSLKNFKIAQEKYDKQLPEESNLDDYDVNTPTGCIGSVELVENASWKDMPTELEINGFTYNLEL